MARKTGSERTLGVGVIGCGNISTTYFQLSPLFKFIEMRACADIDMAAATARANEYGVVAQSVKDLLRNDAIDIVVNLTVPVVHHKVTTAILEAGKHVYSEKPLTLSVEAGKAMAALAKSNRLKVACAPDTILGGAHQQARELPRGVEGEVAVVEGAPERGFQAHQQLDLFQAAQPDVPVERGPGSDRARGAPAAHFGGEGADDGEHLLLRRFDRPWRGLGRHQARLSPMLEAVTIREIQRIFEVTDALGIHREMVVIPLRPGRPGRVRRMPGGKVEIVVEGERSFDEWVAGLAEEIRKAT